MGMELPEWDGHVPGKDKPGHLKYILPWQLAQLHLLQRLCVAVERVAVAQEEIAGVE